MNNKTHKLSNVSVNNAASKAPSMKALATAAMSKDMNAMLASIDEVLASAMQHIDDSLKQSSAQVEEAKKQLLQQHSGLEQAYGSSPSLSLQEEPAINDKETEQKQDQSITQQEQTNDMLESGQKSIKDAVSAIEGKLLEQQKSYELKVASNSLHVQQALQQQALPKAGNEAEQVLKEEQKVSQKQVSQIAEQASAIHKQAKALLTSTDKNENQLMASDTETTTSPSSQTTSEGEK